MTRRKKHKPQKPQAEVPRRVETGPVRKPLLVAQWLSMLVLLVGVVMLVLGAGVASGRITEGWGFPMSAVSNWGRPWGGVLIVTGLAYVMGPVLLLLRPGSGSIVMMIVCGLSVLLGVPLITTTTEILYNLFQQTKSRPIWVDSVWGYDMILNVAIIIALYRAYPTPNRDTNPQRVG